MNYDMDRIEYQVWDAMEYIMEEETRKQIEHQKRVHDQLVVLQ
jgi:hypothetical protein